MLPDEITVRALLVGAPYQAIHSKNFKGGLNTLHDEWDDITEVSPWDKFGLPTLEIHYPELLNMKVENVAFEEGCLGLRYIHSEASVELYLARIIDYVNRILTIVRHAIGRHVQIMKGLPLDSNSLSDRPDWTVTCLSKSENWFENTNYCPGDTKMAQKWNPNPKEIRSYDTSEGVLNNLRPYLQMAHYCVGAERRYGFAFTEKSIVAIQVSHAPENLSQAQPMRPSRNQPLVDYADKRSSSPPDDFLNQSFRSQSSGSYKPQLQPGEIKAYQADWDKDGIAVLVALAIISTDPKVDTSIQESCSTSPVYYAEGQGKEPAPVGKSPTKTLSIRKHETEGKPPTKPGQGQGQRQRPGHSRLSRDDGSPY